MKATGLRIGNYVNEAIRTKNSRKIATFEIKKINSLDIHHLETFNESKNFKPIQLTEEWFYDFGFIIFNSSNEKNNIVINKLINPLKYSIFGHEIKYVHELQNWYFLLTNEELTL